MTAYQRVASAPYSNVSGYVDATPPEVVTAAYDLAWIDHRGAPIWDRRMLPDMPEIREAVSSLARGAMLQGPRGPIAIEDLMPGDRVATRDGGTAQIEWIGTRTYAPGGDRPMFYRVSANAFGASGPETDVVLGANAHVLIDNPRCIPLVGSPLAFAPIAAFEDGHAVTSITPQGEVACFGLACAGQAAILVSGLAVESYHPARATTRNLNRNILSEMGKLFPQAAGGTGFGAPRINYLSLVEAQGLALAGV
ncbi:MAG: Hint domain-containing protein [Pseudomonadota bacterium]